MAIKDDPVTLGVIVGTRGFFNPALAAEGRKQVLSRLEGMGVKTMIAPETATGSGAVGTMTEAAKYGALFKANAALIDGILVTLPNFGDERAVARTLELAGLDVPVLVHAFDDDPDKVDVARRRDAFCGKISVCNNLRQYGIRWTDTREHTCPVDGADFAADIERFTRICRTVRGLRGARIGAVGARPGDFQTVRYSEKLLQASGITVVTVDLSDILAAAERIRESAKEVREKLDAVRGYGRIPNRIEAARVVKSAKLAVALDRWVAENGCSASAVQCWTSVQNNYGCAACLPMSLMGEEGLPSACETDVTGAVSMLALRLAAGSAPGFLDWNNNFGEDRSLCVNTHCSAFPRSFLGAEPEIAELDVLGGTIGREKCFGAVKGKVAPGPMSFFRMDTDDAKGRLRAYAGEGEFTSDPFPMDGGIAVCRISGLRRLLGHVTAEGFEHHVAMVRGHVADAVSEAAGKYLGWDVYRHREAGT
jgi:L-fucose isomerase-like protein